MGNTNSSGTLKIDEGTVIQNNKITNGDTAAGVYAKNGSTIIMSGGEIINNESQNAGGGVGLDKSTMTMTGGTISNNTGRIGGGIYADYSSKLTLKGGSISENEVKRTDEAGAFGGGIALNRKSILEMSGGSVNGNDAGYDEKYLNDEYFGNNKNDVRDRKNGNGGGISINGGSEMKFTGGSVSNNTAHTGGGIYINEGNEEGQKSRLYMYEGENGSSGTVSRNTSIWSGGGIRVYNNGEAVISAGNITDNVSKWGVSGDFGGGAIYVDGHATRPGKLYLYNAEITDNETTYNKNDNNAPAYWDSVIAVCNTGKVQINITDGAVIHDNGAENTIYVRRTSNSSGEIKLPSTMLGGTEYNWIDKDGKALTDGILWNDSYGKTNNSYIAKTEATLREDAVPSQVKVHISGNKSYCYGAALGINGELYIGKRDVALTIHKDWDDSIPDSDREDSIAVTIYRTVDGKNWEKVVLGDPVTLTKENKWQTTVENLPEWDESSKKYTYKVVENTDKYYWDYNISEVDNAHNDKATNWYNVTLTNKYAGDLTVTKKVENGDTNKEFEFTVTLTNGSAKLSDGVYTLSLTDATGTSDETIEVKDGKATFTLKNGQSATIKGLPAGTQYSVAESDKSAKGYRVDLNGETDKTIQNLKTSKEQFKNTLKVGTLDVSKTVKDGKGNADDEFKFNVTLDYSKTYDSNYTGAKEYTYTIHKTDGSSEDVTFTGDNIVLTLKAGEHATINGLPDGTSYTVTEQTADGYSLVSYGEFSGAVDYDNDKTKLTAAFENRYKTGSLWIKKTIDGNGDKQTDFTFNVDLKDKNGNALSGTYTYTYHDVDGKAIGTGTFNGNTVSLKLKDGQYVTIDDLPEGATYSVTEAESAHYVKVNEDYTSDKIIDGIDGAHVLATFTNSLKVGQLKVTKTVTGTGDKTKDFKFKVTLNYSDTYSSEAANSGTYTYTYHKADGSEVKGTFEGSEHEFSLKDGEYITIKNLPEGTTYTVTEDMDDAKGYTEESGGKIEGSISYAEDGSTSTAGFVNMPDFPDFPDNPDEPDDPDIPVIPVIPPIIPVEPVTPTVTPVVEVPVTPAPAEAAPVVVTPAATPATPAPAGAVLPQTGAPVLECAALTLMGLALSIGALFTGKKDKHEK